MLLWPRTVNHLRFEFTSGGISPADKKTQTLLYRLINHRERGPILFGPGQLLSAVHPQFADIAAPLHDLTTDKGTFMWEQKHQEAFETLKNALILPPILDYPRQGDKFILTTDASDSGLGAVLSTSRGTIIKCASLALSHPKRTICYD